MAAIAFAWEELLKIFKEHPDVSEYRGHLAGFKKLLLPHVEVLLEEAEERGRADATLGPAHITKAP